MTREIFWTKKKSSAQLHKLTRRTAMKCEPSGPFDSIESTHEFFALLGEIVTDTRKDIEQDVKKESNGKVSRRIEAMRLAIYNLDKLQVHITKSRRILNDLRSVRRLLFEERKAPAPVTLKPAAEAVKPAPPVAKFATTLAPQVTRPDARPQGAAVA
jgi:hypothetical protein